MADPENIVLVHLREFRSEMQTLRAEMNARFDEVEKRFGAMDRRLDMMRVNGEKALRQFIGHRAMMERTVASVVEDIGGLKEGVDGLDGRVERIEAELALR